MAEDEEWVTTHDWSREVDRHHLATIRSNPGRYAPGGLLHLILEVVAYADDEARELGRPGVCAVLLCEDGSVGIADDGRGTDTRRTASGRIIRKPVMATRDLRFFDTTNPDLLPDGSPRRGISVVAALSDWLVHTNSRSDGAWQQRYESGIPLGELEEIPASGGHGTTVWFRPSAALMAPLSPADVEAAARFDWLEVSCRADPPTG